MCVCARCHSRSPQSFSSSLMGSLNWFLNRAVPPWGWVRAAVGAGLEERMTASPVRSPRRALGQLRAPPGPRHAMKPQQLQRVFPTDLLLTRSPSPLLIHPRPPAVPILGSVPGFLQVTAASPHPTSAPSPHSRALLLHRPGRGPAPSLRMLFQSHTPAVPHRSNSAHTHLSAPSTQRG